MQVNRLLTFFATKLVNPAAERDLVRYLTEFPELIRQIYDLKIKPFRGYTFPVIIAKKERHERYEAIIQSSLAELPIYFEVMQFFNAILGNKHDYDAKQLEVDKFIRVRSSNFIVNCICRLLTFNDKALLNWQLFNVMTGGVKFTSDLVRGACLSADDRHRAKLTTTLSPVLQTLSASYVACFDAAIRQSASTVLVLPIALTSEQWVALGACIIERDTDFLQKLLTYAFNYLETYHAKSLKAINASSTKELSGFLPENLRLFSYACQIIRSLGYPAQKDKLNQLVQCFELEFVKKVAGVTLGGERIAFIAQHLTNMTSIPEKESALSELAGLTPSKVAPAKPSLPSPHTALSMFKPKGTAEVVPSEKQGAVAVPNAGVASH